MSNTSSTRRRRPPQIAVVVSGWPRLSESFALNELLALHEAGMLAAVFATKCGETDVRHPAVAALDKSVHHLGTGTAEQQAAEVVGILGGLRIAGVKVDGVHGYFAHQPAAVARAAAALLGVPFGFSAHAKDPRKVEQLDLADRARAASCVVVCNADVASQLHDVGAEPTLVQHGVDTVLFKPRLFKPRLFKPQLLRPQLRTNAAMLPGRRVELLAVGRLVAKKGFDVLIEAVRLLDFDWRLRIVGDGPLRQHLHDLAQSTTDGDRIEFLGTRTHADLPELYHGTDIVAVPSVIDADGDRDGLPNVVLEAMACGLAIVASDVAAIPTAIEHRQNGLLVEPGDVHGLANALNEFAKDAELRAALGANARSRAESQFGLGPCTDRFLSILEAAYG
jgi:glycosyltransferase involved in cell wall biosynthesis